MKSEMVLYYLYMAINLLAISVSCQNCSNIPEFGPCSANPECRCFQPLHSQTQYCGLLSTSCPELPPCGGTNQDVCFIPGQLCIRFPRCFPYNVCYPSDFIGQTLCPPLAPTTTTVETTTSINTAMCPNECKNGGTCSGPNTCSCTYGWRGPTCEEHYCPSGCFNGGTCSGPDNCQCSSGWLGSTCETYHCISSCLNNGECVGPNTCSCPSGWKGPVCETYHCTPYCLNNGNCVGPNTCSCLSGWTGAICQTYYCSSACLNGGYCNGPNICYCYSPYYGSYCQYKKSTGSCYSGKDFVTLINGEQRSIEDLKLGDRVWNIDPYHPHKLIEDEILMMAHLEPNKTAEFYTFETIDGHQISLTGPHLIAVFDSDRNKTKLIQSAKVTIDDQLILRGRTVPIREIRKNVQLGFYSPLTLTSYLMVNGISTSVFSDSYESSQEKVHFILAPLRLYYRLTRYLLGSEYQPFAKIQHGLHPIIASYKRFPVELRIMVKILPYMVTFVLALPVCFLIRKLSKRTISIKQKVH